MGIPLAAPPTSLVDKSATVEDSVEVSDVTLFAVDPTVEDEDDDEDDDEEGKAEEVEGEEDDADKDDEPVVDGW